MMKTMWPLISAIALVCQIHGVRAETEAPSQPVQLRIESQLLVAALNEWASKTGYMVLVSVDERVEEVIAPRIDGNYTPETALKLLLSSSGMKYEFVNARTVSIRSKEAAASSRADSAFSQRGDNARLLQLAAVDDENEEKTDGTVVVQGQREVEGTATKGYRNKSATQLGVLGAKDLEDTPLSVSVISSALLENLMATSPDDVYRLSPVAQLSVPEGRAQSQVKLRGFELSSDGINGANQVDGMMASSTTSGPIEDKERVEIVTGLSGFLYGAGNVGGTVNYVLKRPTEQRMLRLRAGNTSGTSLYGHLDMGGPIDGEGRFGYRLNILGQDGDLQLDHQALNRKLFSGALDWKLTDKLLLQIDASRSTYRLDGTEPYWIVGNQSLRYNPPKGNRYYGQPDAFVDRLSRHVAARASWQMNEMFSLRAAVSRRHGGADTIIPLNFATTPVYGEYSSSMARYEWPDRDSDAAYLYADLAFDTGAVNHRLVTGYTGSDTKATNFRGSNFLPGGFTTSVVDPAYITEMPGTYNSPKYLQSQTRLHNIVAGDELTLGRLTALLGLTHVRIDSESFPEPGSSEVVTPYNENATTPSATLMYRFQSGLRLYANYLQSFEQGGMAEPNFTFEGQVLSVVNMGQVFPPLESKQVELGAKFAVGEALLTAALFEIDKGLQYYEPINSTEARYVQDGRQVHRGAEVTLTGRVTPRLTVVGGVTLLDPKTKENRSSPELEGKAPQWVSEEVAKVYAEYDVASISGLTLSGGVFYTSEKFIDSMNTDTIPSHTLVDVGVRYGMQAWGDRKVLLRLNIHNVTDENYWLTPSYLGTPRTVVLGAQLDF